MMLQMEALETSGKVSFVVVLLGEGGPGTMLGDGAHRCHDSGAQLRLGNCPVFATGKGERKVVRKGCCISFQLAS